MAEAITSKAHPPPAGVRDEEEMIQRRTLRDYYIILLERLWVALPLALLVSIGYGYWQSRATPMYSSTATMQFEKPDTVVLTQGVVDPSVHSDVDINNYIQILNSRKLTSKVIESFTHDQQQILLRPALKKLLPGQSPPSVAQMLGSVTAQAVPRSYMIEVTVEHPDPEAAAIVANAYIDQFMNQLAEDVDLDDTDALKYLDTRVEQLRQQSEDAEAKLERYMQEHNLVSLDGSLNLIADNLKTVSGQLESANLQLLNLKTLSQQIDDFRKQGMDRLLEIPEIAQHGTVPVLRGQLTELRQQQAALSERYLERHPKMVDIAGRIQVTQDLLNQAINQAIADFATQLAEKREDVASLEAESEKNLQQELHLKAMGIDYNSLQQQADIAKANYSQILDRINSTETTRGVNIEKLPVHRLDNAIPSSFPYSPNMKSIVHTSISLGILTFIGVAVGLSFIDDRIKSAWDIESFIGANLLGIVPDLSSLKPEEKYTLMLENKQSLAVEPFLGLYSSIKIHSKLDFPKSILITSTIPGEGKTLICANLAGCFARQGKRTLLVDCDLRRPMMHRHFRQQNATGLITWFEAGANLDGDLAADPNLGIVQIAENLWLLSSGGRSKSPTGMLENPAFGQLLDRLKRRFDLLMIDSPPMGAVTDSLLVAERTDEIVYVCRFNRAYRKHIRLYTRTLAYGKNTVLGIVLNGLSPRRIEYYSNYRYYRSYKKYYGAQT